MILGTRDAHNALDAITDYLDLPRTRQRPRLHADSDVTVSFEDYAGSLRRLRESEEVRYGEFVTFLTGLDRAIGDNAQRLATQSPVKPSGASQLLNISFVSLHEPLYGLDYLLEVREDRPVITEAHFPSLHLYLITIEGYDEKLKREAGHGYHFHYVQARPQGRRTNALFTFHPKEPLRYPNNLYWQYHGSGHNVRIAQFRQPRRRAIHSAAEQSLNVIQKSDFRHPSQKAAVLYPRRKD